MTKSEAPTYCLFFRGYFGELEVANFFSVTNDLAVNKNNVP